MTEHINERLEYIFNDEEVSHFRRKNLVISIISNPLSAVNPHASIGKYICKHWDEFIGKSNERVVVNYQRLYVYLVACTTRL